jgi:hypothetical protein
MVLAALALVTFKDLVGSWIAFQGGFLLGLQVPLTSKAVGNTHAPSQHILWWTGVLVFALVGVPCGSVSSLSSCSPTVAASRSSASSTHELSVEPSRSTMLRTRPPSLSVGSSRGGKAGSCLRSVRLGCSGGASSMRSRSPTAMYCPRPASSPPQGPPTPRALQLQLSQLHQWVRRRQCPWWEQVRCLWPTTLPLVRAPQCSWVWQPRPQPHHLQSHRQAHSRISQYP